MIEPTKILSLYLIDNKTQPLKFSDPSTSPTFQIQWSTLWAFIQSSFEYITEILAACSFYKHQLSMIAKNHSKMKLSKLVSELIAL